MPVNWASANSEALCRQVESAYGAAVIGVMPPVRRSGRVGQQRDLSGRLGIGIFSPRLDLKGNSVRVCEELSLLFGLHVFESNASRESLDGQLRVRRSR